MTKGEEMRNQIAIQRQNLEVKAQASGLTFGITLLVKGIFCSDPQPGNALCYALDRVAEDQAKDFGTTVLALTLHDALYQ